MSPSDLSVFIFSYCIRNEKQVFQFWPTPQNVKQLTFYVQQSDDFW